MVSKQAFSVQYWYERRKLNFFRENGYKTHFSVQIFYERRKNFLKSDGNSIYADSVVWKEEKSKSFQESVTNRIFLYRYVVKGRKFKIFLRKRHKLTVAVPIWRGRRNNKILSQAIIQISLCQIVLCGRNKTFFNIRLLNR